MSLVGMGECLGWWDPSMGVVLVMVVRWLAEITFSNLTTWCHIGAFTAWNFL